MYFCTKAQYLTSIFFQTQFEDEPEYKSNSKDSMPNTLAIPHHLGIRKVSDMASPLTPVQSHQSKYLTNI